MNVVYILAVILFFPSVWYLLRPLAHAGGDQQGSEQRHQLNLLRDRLLSQIRELEQQAADGVLDDAVVDDERARLEAELAPVLGELDSFSSDVSTPTEQALSKKRQRLWMLTMGVFLLPLTLTIFSINSWDTLRALYAEPPSVSMPPMVMKMVQRLEQRLQKSPDDPQGWSRLGRAYYVLRRLEEAKGAYARSYKLAPNDPGIVAAYASFLYQMNPQATRGEVRTVYSRLRKLKPDHPGVMWFFGLVAYEEGNLNGALKQWQRLQQFLPTDSDAGRSVDKAIMQVKAEMRKAR